MLRLGKGGCTDEHTREDDNRGEEGLHACRFCMQWA
jgi:hypothetical protein